VTSGAPSYLSNVDPSDTPRAIELGLALVREGRGRAAIRLAEKALAHARGHPGLWQILGLAARLDQRSALALRAFSEAARLNPSDALIAQSFAQAALEAGKPAIDLFRNAAALSPANAAVLQGLSAALVAENRASEAVSGMHQLLEANPLWIEGHKTYAQIAGQVGSAGDPRATIRKALQRFGRNAELHRSLIALDFELGDFEAAISHLDHASSMLGDSRWITNWLAFAASETGRIKQADHYFKQMYAPRDIDEAFRKVRHYVRTKRIDRASALAEEWRLHDPTGILWPYFSIIWRSTGDDRWCWLEGQQEFIGVFDLSERISSLAALAEQLRKLHFANRQPLDQSVRLGTQTDGNLFLRLEPEIIELRTAVLSAVEDYIGKLPPADSDHPLLRHAREPVRIEGSWSVRLTNGGFHVDHVHTRGWISSACYISLPDSQIGKGEGPDDHAGWLSLGECQELAPELPPVRLIEPKPGRLVLFPSTMWHGTRPFSEGERLTAAFDIAKPPLE